MTATYLKNTKSKFSNWLIRIVLLFSVFSFSGYVNPSYSELPQSVQTELIWEGNKVLLKKTPHLDKIKSKPYEKSVSDKTYLNFKSALIAYNILIKIKFDTNSRKFNFYTLPTPFLQTKIISSTSDKKLPYFNLVHLV